MVKYKCGHCGYEGPCYGVATSKGVSAPFCPKCEKNDKLTLLGDTDEVILEINRETAIACFGRFLGSSNTINELVKSLKENGRLECKYESGKKKWTMEVKEEDIQ